MTPQEVTGSTVTETAPESRAYSRAYESQNGLEIDADLARVLDAWPTLPDAIRVGILAMVEAARQKS